ncbi:MAG: helix-turn-helix domain-containing protein, partial [Thermomicrobiales bacterium]
MSQQDKTNRPTEQLAAQARRVQALAAIVKIVRTKEGKSIEAAAKEAGVGHMTWRRLEEGNTVRAQTYAALDRAYSLPPGTALRAVNTDEGIVNLATHFAIGIVEASEYPPPQFVAEL